MRWRLSGTNWEGRGWYLAPCLATLAGQIDVLHPDRQPGDGTVASKNHDANSPSSDHRPRPFTAKTGAIVRAIDVGETSEASGQLLVDQLIASKDPRIMYVIYEGRSCWSVPRNGYPAWRWQPYGGANPHSHHFHLSTVRDSRVDNNTNPWAIGGSMHTHKPMPEDLPRDWADGTWQAWVKASGTDPKTRTHDFYREDLSWVYSRVIQPLEQEVDQLRREVNILKAEGGGGGGVSEARVRELINASRNRI